MGKFIVMNITKFYFQTFPRKDFNHKTFLGFSLEVLRDNLRRVPSHRNFFKLLLSFWRKNCVRG